MVGMFCAVRFLGNLVNIDGIMTADTYIDILRDNVEESLLNVGSEDCLSTK